MSATEVTVASAYGYGIRSCSQAIDAIEAVLQQDPGRWTCLRWTQAG